MSLQPIWCIFSNFTFDRLVHLSQHICGGPWSRPRGPVREDFGEIWKTLQQKAFWTSKSGSYDFFFCFSFFYTSSFFKLHMRRLPENVCQGKQESCFRQSWQKTVSFQHLADFQRHSFIVSPAADLMFEALAAVFFLGVWHKICAIWRCRDEKSDLKSRAVYCSHRRVQVREDGLRSGLHLEMFTSTEGGKGGRE